MLDRSPVVVLCLGENVQSSLDIGKIRPERFDDGQDLVGMDAPHPQEAKLLTGSPGVASDDLPVLEFRRHVVGGDDAVSQGRCRNFRFGAGNQRMIELSRAGHRPPGNGTVVAGNKVHESEVQALDTGESGDVPDLAQRTMGLDQNMNGNRSGDAVGGLATQLSHLNPTAVLARGYSITRRSDGRIVRAAAELALGERLSLTFADGGAQVRVEAKRAP